jgi:Domain of unknown function (DUF4332)
MLIPILRAARCRSTHHFFAIDALERIVDPMSVSRVGRLRDLLLKHYSDYLLGSKDPDDQFKDFQNHVLHVSDHCWGGAPKACRHWLEKAIEHLNAGQWREAAYSCGVLSHYFTDPMMPLHTGQSDRETVVHRPMEWSICKSYEDIYALCQFAKARVHLSLGTGDNWIEQAVIDGATFAHQHYHRLIEIYNLTRGAADPRQGLGIEARRTLSELFDLALSGWAAVLTRIASLTSVELPDSSLTMATLIATIDVPRAFVVKQFTDSAERSAVQRIFDEYTSTGKLDAGMPLESKVVRKERENDRKAEEPRPAGLSTEQRPTLSTAKTHKKRVNERPRQIAIKPDVEPVRVLIGPRRPEPIVKFPAAATNPTRPAELAKVEAASVDVPVIAAPTQSKQTSPKSAEAAGVPLKSPRILQETSQAVTISPESNDVGQLTENSPIVDAPSIGPKTAVRFHEIGIKTIGQFLDADPDWMAIELKTGWIKPDLLQRWQEQAELVCDVPALCGYKAQLLVAVGIRNADELQAANVATLYPNIVQFCASKEAERFLRSAPVPDRNEVQRWINSARSPSVQA